MPTGKPSLVLTVFGFAVLLAVLGLLAHQMLVPSKNHATPTASVAGENGGIMVSVGPEMPTATDTRAENIGADGRPFVAGPAATPVPTPEEMRNPEVPRVTNVPEPPKRNTQTGDPNPDANPQQCRRCPAPVLATPTTPTPEPFPPSVGLKPTTLPISSQP